MYDFEVFMDFDRLNPFIRSVALYEKEIGGEMRVGRDARLLFMLSGNVTVRIGNTPKVRLAPGAFCYIPAGRGYRLKSEGARFVYITFDLSDARAACVDPLPTEVVTDPDALGDPDPQDRPFDREILIEDMASERERFLEMHRIFVSAAGEYRARISAMLKQILLRVAEEADEDALPSRMIEALDAYIRENGCDDISNTEIGAVFGYHPFYISQMLKKKLGVTLRQYIIAYRLKSAKNMLRYTAKTITEIAQETGFTDASYFTKSFKAAFDLTPKDYRAAFKDEQI